MSPILELEERVEAPHSTPKLLVEWSSRWEEFVGSIKPALARSQARLAGEAPFGLIPFRIMIPSYVVEAFLILSAIFVQVKIDQLRPVVVPTFSSHDVIYYSGDELPRTQDLGGAESGRSGQAGGEEAHHRTQTIKVARGGSLVPKVVDAPNLKLPSSHEAVANLLAIRPDPGPPPAEGLRSSRSAPNLTTTLIAPSPDVIRDYTRNGIKLDPVAAPAPSVSRNQPLTAPNFNTSLVPPAPNVTNDHTLVAPALATSIVPPAPTVSRDHPLMAPSLETSVSPPDQNLKRDPFRAAPTLSANVVPPAPVAVSRQFSSAPVQAMDPGVVPPPVSAPERAGVRNSKLTLPAPAAVAPPPSTDVTADIHRMTGSNAAGPSKAVVPPPPSPSASGSLVSNLIGRIFGPAEVVAPPPSSVSARSSGSASRPTLGDNVAAPPVSVSATDGVGNPRGSRNGVGAALGSTVAPPPSVGLTGGTGTSRSSAAPYLGNPSVVPPPPSLAGTGGGTGKTAGTAGTAGGQLLAGNIIPPPPAIGGEPNASGSGAGRKGLGLGAPSDVGSGIAPPTNGGSGKDSGTVMSNQPGSKIGVPPDPKTGSLAMSPAGGSKPGLGGTGGGSSIGRGNGPGSGMIGSGTGAANTGAGHGSDPNARGGISPANGPGGAGNIPAGKPAVPGVDISGGSNIVTLPSFGSDPAGTDPTAAGRSSLKQHKKTLDVTVVATANSGGAFEPYRKLFRSETYTGYIDTTLGTVVMEFADESDTTHAFGRTLTAPVALSSNLPEGLPHGRMLVACTLDASGNLKNPKVLEPGPVQMTAKVLAALRTWKFEPAMRNNQPVEVTAILGFGIDTSDRF
ncbi:MAG TPA: TonB family protein [Candidatus Sulfotelmatobacter sp.]|nr:TonB family protein [Candidatus Sulfotelmatobacter sp.]